MLQYFEAVGNSPSKKRRKVGMESEEEEEMDLSQKRMEEERAMAEYEDDDQHIIDEDEEAGLDDLEAITRPISKTAQKPPSCRNPAKDPGNSSKPKSRSNKAKAPNTEQECPICSKVWETDNAGLNEHIDFCLSKGAIMAATAVR